MSAQIMPRPPDSTIVRFFWLLLWDSPPKRVITWIVCIWILCTLAPFAWFGEWWGAVWWYLAWPLSAYFKDIWEYWGNIPYIAGVSIVDFLLYVLALQAIWNLIARMRGGPKVEVAPA